MSKLGQVVEAVENYNEFVLKEVKRARTDEAFGQQMVDRWNELKAKTPIGTAPTGLKLPRLALPEIDEAGEITRYLFGEGLPGEFPFTNGAYREMYLEPLRELEAGSYGKNGKNGKNGHDQERQKTARRWPRRKPSKSRNRRGFSPDSAWPKTRTRAFIFSPAINAARV